MDVLHITGPEQLSILGAARPAGAVITLPCPGYEPEALLDAVGQVHPGLPVAFYREDGPAREAVRLLRLGAAEYFDDWEEAEGWRPCVGRAETPVESWRLFLVGDSPVMQPVFDTIRILGPRRSTVLIQGETGTGKEMVARALHAASTRAMAPMVSVNCTALPDTLLEAELFGHTRGAFTGAMQARTGRFEQAQRGTIFLDEIGDLPFEIQAKLLRVLQERECQRLGSGETVKLDVRVVAATNAELERRIEQGKFREDLYYRLNVIQLALPPLRERKEDIPLLVEHFFDKYCRENEKFLGENGKSMLQFEPEAMQLVMEHSWPGNVRELENTIERAVVLATSAWVPATVLPDSVLHPSGVRIRRDDAGRLAPDASLYEIVADFERRTIVDVLENVNYSQTEAAERLSIPLSTLNQKIKRLNIEIGRGGRGG